MRKWVGCLAAVCAAFVVSTASAVILHVDHNSPANGPGTEDDWSDAFNNLGDALVAANAADRIWVADGTYKPGASQGDRFVMKDGVIVLGGFTGNETLENQRNPYANGTILSGEIGAAGATDNCQNVVWVPSTLTDVNTRLDGFAITGGYDDNNTHGLGGGIYALGRIIVRQCTIINNYALNYGGGFYGDSGSLVTFRICEFSLNSADTAGGGAATAGTVKLLDCNLHDNSALLLGGGVYGNRCVEVKLVCCTVKENSTSGNGGGISIDGSGSGVPACTMHNSLIVENQAGSNGGGLHATESTASLITCTFASNDGGGTGGAILLDGMSSTAITNCILWDDVASTSGPEISVVGTAPTIAYSDVEGTWTGTGNINSNPNFDELQCPSPCVNVASNGAVPADAEDVDGDANTGEDTPDRDLSTRILVQVDMGAYEKGADFCPADVNNNNVVNVDDLLAVINGWVSCGTPCPADIAPLPCGNGVVNVDDLLAVINGWGPCPTFSGGENDMPTSMQDCMDICDAANPGDLEGYTDCVNKCVNALCEAEIIDCD